MTAGFDASRRLRRVGLAAGGYVGARVPVGFVRIGRSG
jgi:hypothetical protein